MYFFQPFTFAFSAMIFFCPNKVVPSEILGIFPMPVNSHLIVFDTLMMELARRGHSVTIYRPFPKNRSIPGYWEVDLTNCFSADVSPFLNETIEYVSPVASMKMIMKLNPSYQQIQNCRPIVNLLNSSHKYDLLITESFNNDFYLFFGHKLKIPVIAFRANIPQPWMMEWTGLPLNPSYIPFLMASYHPKMKFVERLMNSLLYLYSILEYKFSSDNVYDGMASKFFGPSIPSLSEIRKNTSMLFLYANMIVNFPIPSVPNVLQVGGLHIKKADSLPEVCNIIFFMLELKMLYFFIR